MHAYIHTDPVEQSRKRVVIHNTYIHTYIHTDPVEQSRKRAVIQRRGEVRKPIVVCIHAYVIYIYICMYVCMHVCMLSFRGVEKCVSRSWYVYMHMLYIYICMYVYMYAYTHTYTLTAGWYLHPALARGSTSRGTERDVGAIIFVQLSRPYEAPNHPWRDEHNTGRNAGQITCLFVCVCV